MWSYFKLFFCNPYNLLYWRQILSNMASILNTWTYCINVSGNRPSPTTQVNYHQQPNRPGAGNVAQQNRNAGYSTSQPPVTYNNPTQSYSTPAFSTTPPQPPPKPTTPAQVRVEPWSKCCLYLRINGSVLVWVIDLQTTFSYVSYNLMSFLKSLKLITLL